MSVVCGDWEAARRSVQQASKPSCNGRIINGRFFDDSIFNGWIMDSPLHGA
jgi:hypothetical protein